MPLLNATIQLVLKFNGFFFQFAKFIFHSFHLQIISKMLALRILLSVSFIFAIAFAYTQNTDVKLNVFTPNNNFESNLLEKLQTTKNFFKNKYVSAAFMTTAVALSFVPVPGIAIINPIRLLLEEESDWKPSFAAAVTDKIDHGDLLTTIKDIESKIGNIDEHIRILNNSKIADDLRRTSAELVHHDYNEIIHKFKNSKTLFKKYALITSPVLVALATSFAQFYPTALSMIPEIVNDLKIPCKVLDLLFEYRPIAVDDRFDKIGWTLGYKKRVHAVSQLENVRVKPYDENGYDDSNALSCDKGCVDDETVFKKNMMCLKDQYGFDEYLALNYSDPECLEGYAALVRERVEQMFPVKFYNELCERNSIPTGKFQFII